MINIKFLVVSYFISLFVDWIFQSDWQASHKSKWGKEDNKIGSFFALLLHSLIYAFGTTGYSFIVVRDSSYLFPIFFTLLISHMIIDTRIPVKFIMKLKGMSKEQISDYQNFGFLHIGIDQRLHELVLLILAFFIR